MIIAVSGSPGTGKTTLAKELADKLNHKYIDVNQFIKEKGLSEGYDSHRECEIVDIKKLNKELITLIENQKDVVIDSHLSHNLPKRYLDICIITKCDLKVLEQRLRQRGYSDTKIRENLDVEIFDSCLEEAREQNHKIIVIDTSRGYDMEDIIKKIR